MATRLFIIPADKMQERINSIVKSFKQKQGIYVSLNKTQRNIEKILARIGIDTKRLFFIDCVTTEKNNGVLHIAPDQPVLLESAIDDFIRFIKGEKFLLIDGLSTLLLYNTEDSVAKFAKKITEYAPDKKVEVVAFSPKTQGEELLTKIFNFFEKVKKR